MNLTTNEIANLAAEAYHAHCNGDPDKRSMEVLEYLDRNPDFESRILQRLKSVFPWLLERAGREEDFREFCEKEGIWFAFDEKIPAGMYSLFNPGGNTDAHWIHINPQPISTTREYTMFHEAAHYLFHSPYFSWRGGRAVTRYDTAEGYGEIGSTKHIEAEIAASLCVTKANYF